MKKALKTLLIIVIVAVILAGAIGGYIFVQYKNNYIGKQAALDIALSDAGKLRAEVFSVETEFEKVRDMAWYDVDFETPQLEYGYRIDARTGAIINAYSEPND